MKIEIYPSKILSQVAQEVAVDKLPLYKEFIKNMITCIKEHNAFGLAAPQVGVNKRIIVWLDGEGKPRVYINPVIISSFGKIITEEGCLSFPGYQKRIKRKRGINIKAINEKGETIYWVLENMDAVIVQHEIDHLNGITILSSKKQRKQRKK